MVMWRGHSNQATGTKKRLLRCVRRWKNGSAMLDKTTLRGFRSALGISSNVVAGFSPRSAPPNGYMFRNRTRPLGAVAQPSRTLATPLLIRLVRGCCETHEEASVGAVYDRAFFLDSTKRARS